MSNPSINLLIEPDPRPSIQANAIPTILPYDSNFTKSHERLDNSSHLLHNPTTESKYSINKDTRSSQSTQNDELNKRKFANSNS